MLICVGLLFLTCANTAYVFNNGEVYNNDINDVNTQWVSLKDVSKLNIHKRETILTSQSNPEQENTKVVDSENPESVAKVPGGLSEGGGVNVNPPSNNSISAPNKSQEPQLSKSTNIAEHKILNTSNPLDMSKDAISIKPVNETISNLNKTVAETNATVVNSDNLSPINSPGVMKRGLIVFGGFAILAIAYLIFYRKKNNKYDSNNSSANDANQFRYGVLQSEDRRDNLELARIPLTMESDDDDDEDLEIFDLEQKKKSLSYVNLQLNDEDVVLNNSKDESKNNLLLDIEDGPSDTLINWSSNGNKSIL